jgi:hypothetical protein
MYFDPVRYVVLGAAWIFLGLLVFGMIVSAIKDGGGR